MSLIIIFHLCDHFIILHFISWSGESKYMTSDVCITEKLRKHAHTHTPCPKLALCPHAVSLSHTHTHFKGQYRQFPASKVLKNGNWGPPAPLSRSLKKFTRFSPRRFTSFVSLGLWSLLLVSLLLVPFFFSLSVSDRRKCEKAQTFFTDRLWEWHIYGNLGVHKYVIFVCWVISKNVTLGCELWVLYFSSSTFTFYWHIRHKPKQFHFYARQLIKIGAFKTKNSLSPV